MASCVWVPMPGRDHVKVCAVCQRAVDLSKMAVRTLEHPCKGGGFERMAEQQIKGTEPEPATVAPPSRPEPPKATGPALRIDPDPVKLPGELAVLVTYFNPAGVASLRQNYVRFMSDIRTFGVPVFNAEVAYPGQEFVDPGASLKLHATWEKNLLWQKERLLNHMAAGLPDRFDKVAWVDADILFLDRNVFARTAEALESWPVLQMWGRWHFTDHRGTIILSGDSVGHLAERFLRGGGHPGGAWAARRSVFELDETHILGGGDTVSLEAWVGRRDTFLQRFMTPPWRAFYDEWAVKQFDRIRGRVTALEGEAIHLYHGSRDNRRYNDRSHWLHDFGLNPERHLEIQDNGLLAFTDEAPAGLRSIVRDYWFQVRKEDEGLT